MAWTGWVVPETVCSAAWARPGSPESRVSNAPFSGLVASNVSDWSCSTASAIFRASGSVG